MPRARLTKNLGLPPRSHWHHGAIHYMVPRGQEPAWDGRKKFRLGKTVAEAFKTYSSRISAIENATPEVAAYLGIRTVGEALDQYFLKASSQKAATSRQNDANGIRQLKHVFGHLPLRAIKVAMVQDYVRHRQAYETSKKEVSVLTKMFDYAVGWGLVKENPIRGKMNWEEFKGLKKAGKRSKHYVGDDDFINAALCGEDWMWAYLSLKLATGLRGEDMRLLTCSQVTEQGLVTPISKDGDREDVRVRIYELGDLTQAEVMAQAAGRPGDAPLFPHPETGEHFTKRSFQWQWDKMMKKHVANGGRRFNEHLVRGKAGSDEPDLKLAVKLLGHRSDRVTIDHYRLSTERVRALGR